MKARSLLAPAHTFDLSKPLLDLVGCRGPVTRHSLQWVSDIYSSGGGGVIYRGTGAILPPTIHTTQIHRQEFWVGNQYQYQLTGRQDVALAPGHEVGVLVANGIPAQVINYTTGVIYCTASVSEVVPQLPVQPFGKLARNVLWDTPLLTMLASCGVVIVLSGLGQLLHLGHTVTTKLVSITMILALVVFVGLTVRTLYRRWHVPRLNAALRGRGHAEIVATCREKFGVDPLL